MKLALIIFLLFIAFSGRAQQIVVPKGIVYKYVDSLSNEKAKALIIKELSDSVNYLLDMGIVFIGPVLWSRYKSIPSLNAIKGGDITIRGYKSDGPSAKATQNKEGFKLVWDHFREEIKNSSYKLRKATPSELNYYWSVIAFDIEEPLIILETDAHNYILNLSPKDFKLVWFDEAPRQ
jgi:hypothetical protein